MVDVISDLPIEVIDAILVRLPLKDAVRTSILSKKWSNKWVNISELVFTDLCLSGRICETGPSDALELVSIVDQVLSLHQGSLNKFMFYSSVPRFSAVDRWLIYLSMKGVQELIITAAAAFEKFYYYEISSRIFCCQEIRSLGLHYCVVTLPTSAEIFPNLKSLQLSKVIWAEGDINTMISKCPLLERLTIKAEGHTSIKINAPFLKFLNLSDEIANVHFESAPVLSEMHISYTVFCSRNMVVSNSTFLPSLCHLPNIRKLTLGSMKIMRHFPEHRVPLMLPTALCNLENLTVLVDFQDDKDIVGLLCLLRSSPGLQKLSVHCVCSKRRCPTQINRGPPLPREYWEAAKNLNCSMNNLLEVSITGMYGAATELEFIRMVLASSPVLRKITITKSREDMKIFKHLVRFKRASAEAELFWI